MRNWLAALLLTASVGCSPALFSPVERDDPEEMKARIQELQQQAQTSEAELERLRSQVAALEAEGASSTKADADIRPTLDDGITPLSMDDEPIESVDIPPPPRPSAPSSSTPTVATPTVVRGPLPEDGQILYDRGYTLYHQGQYVDAESAFQQFLNAYPESELADNAHYWIGEARFSRADYRSALTGFQETVSRYPDGNKVPDAMVRGADCLARLGDVEAARAGYSEVIRRFPSSAAAITAEERRATLP